MVCHATTSDAFILYLGTSSSHSYPVILTLFPANTNSRQQRMAQVCGARMVVLVSGFSLAESWLL